MTQTIYRLTNGTYDDVRTLGVFASRELAERFIVRWVLDHKCCDHMEIVEEQLVIDDIDTEGSPMEKNPKADRGNENLPEWLRHNQLMKEMERHNVTAPRRTIIDNRKNGGK